jgi:hypothetical protein
MKSKLCKFAFPIGMGVILTVITVIALMSTTFMGCKKDATTTKHCTNSAYPLWCPNAKVCCTPGHAYYCDGQCYTDGCPSTTITRDNCAPE